MDRLEPGEVSFVRAVTEPAAQAPYRGTVAGGGALNPAVRANRGTCGTSGAVSRA
jgi:hypothetical protein